MKIERHQCQCGRSAIIRLNGTWYCLLCYENELARISGRIRTAYENARRPHD